MSLRYIAPILSLSMSSFLCGSEPSSPNCVQNNSFARASVNLQQDASVGCMLTVGEKFSEGMLRQVSGVSCDGGRKTPLTPLNVNTVNRPEGQGALVPSNMLMVLEQRQSLGLEYKNQEIKNAVSKLEINDLTESDKAICQELMNSQENWGNISKTLKQRIINASPERYSTEDGWFYILEEWISLEYFLVLARPGVVENERVSQGSEQKKRLGCRCGSFDN